MKTEGQAPDSEAPQRLLDQLRAAAGQVDAAVKDHPYQVMAFALGVGALAGALMRNPCRETRRPARKENPGP